jgi:hypothetical protein
MSTNVDRVKDTIRKLLNLAANDAATEGEVNNAIRFARKLMLEHQLSDEDCKANDESDEERIARAECQQFSINSQSAKCSGWESDLSTFVCHFIGGVRCYWKTNQIRRVNGIVQNANGSARCAVFTFFGLTGDAAVAQRVFEELSITIAAMGQLKWGGAFKGPGREYCEGFVLGLFEQLKRADSEHKAAESTALTVRRDALVKLKNDRAEEYLKKDIGIKLVSASRRGDEYHGDARHEGKADGARAQVTGRSAKIGNARVAIGSA